MEETRAFIYDQIRYFHHDIGHAINWRGINMNTFKNPPHIRRNLILVVENLIEEGILERKNDMEFLTEKGYNEVYGLS